MINLIHNYKLLQTDLNNFLKRIYKMSIFKWINNKIKKIILNKVPLC